MQPRTAVHVIDDDHKRRARIARVAYSLGHHAEVYASSRELTDCAPREGVVVALEDAVQGNFSDLVGLLNRDGQWLAVIATSAAPSIEKAVRAIKDGARDYLPLPLDEAAFARALDSAAEDSLKIHSDIQRRQAAIEALGRLTHREREVVAQMAQGSTNKETGRRLAISPRTVEIHRTNAIAKLNASTSAGVIRLFFEAGGLDGDSDGALGASP